MKIVIVHLDSSQLPSDQYDSSSDYKYFRFEEPSHSLDLLLTKLASKTSAQVIRKEGHISGLLLPDDDTLINSFIENLIKAFKKANIIADIEQESSMIQLTK